MPCGVEVESLVSEKPLYSRGNRRRSQRKHRVYFKPEPLKESDKFFTFRILRQFSTRGKIFHPRQSLSKRRRNNQLSFPLKTSLHKLSLGMGNTGSILENLTFLPYFPAISFATSTIFKYPSSSIFSTKFSERITPRIFSPAPKTLYFFLKSSKERGFPFSYAFP